MHAVPIEGQLVGKVVQALGATPMFSSLPPESLQQVAPHGELLQYDTGEVVVEEGHREREIL